MIAKEAQPYVPGWNLVHSKLKTSDVLVRSQGRYKVVLERGTETFVLGELAFVWVPAPPLTEDRLAALKSDPSAMKRVVLVINCHKCDAGINVYCGLERDRDYERLGNTWYGEIPDGFSGKAGFALDRSPGVAGRVRRFIGKVRFHVRFDAANRDAFQQSRL